MELSFEIWGFYLWKHIHMFIIIVLFQLPRRAHILSFNLL